MSSIRRIVMAASVANLRLLILEMAGSSTPAFLLSRTTPSYRSNPTLGDKITEKIATRRWPIPWVLYFITLYFKTALIIRSPIFCSKVQFCVLLNLYFKTTCNIRPHLHGPMSGIKIEGPLYMLLIYFCPKVFHMQTHLDRSNLFLKGGTLY